MKKKSRSVKICSKMIVSISSHMQSKTAHFFISLSLWTPRSALTNTMTTSVRAHIAPVPFLWWLAYDIHVCCCLALCTSACVSQRKLNQVLLNCLSSMIQAYVQMLNQRIYAFVLHSFSCTLLSLLQRVIISVSIVRNNNVFISA